MKKLVRRLLVHYDHYGVVAAFAWLAACNGLLAATLIPAEMLFSNVIKIEPPISAFCSIFLLSPMVIYVAPTYWSTLFLIADSMWMFLGIHEFQGWEPHRFRKLIGRLVDEKL